MSGSVVGDYKRQQWRQVIFIRALTISLALVPIAMLAK
jgi:hypothetical protein